MNAEAVLVVIIFLGSVVIWHAIWPYGPCPACRGRRGRGPGSSSAAWSRCRRCGGHGERLRFLSSLIRRDLANGRGASHTRR
jgi:hypothetical protein